VAWAAIPEGDFPSQGGKGEKNLKLPRKHVRHFDTYKYLTDTSSIPIDQRQPLLQAVWALMETLPSTPDQEPRQDFSFIYRQRKYRLQSALELLLTEITLYTKWLDYLHDSSQLTAPWDTRFRILDVKEYLDRMHPALPRPTNNRRGIIGWVARRLEQGRQEYALEEFRRSRTHLLEKPPLANGKLIKALERQLGFSPDRTPAEDIPFLPEERLTVVQDRVTASRAYVACLFENIDCYTR
jgi:hypothetical protein